MTSASNPIYFTNQTAFKETLTQLAKANSICVDAQGSLIPSQLLQNMFKGGVVDNSRLVELKVMEFLIQGKQWLLPADLKLVESLAQKAGLFLGKTNSVKDHKELRLLISLLAKEVLQKEPVSLSDYTNLCQAFQAHYRRILAPFSQQCAQISKTFADTYKVKEEKNNNGSYAGFSDQDKASDGNKNSQDNNGKPQKQPQIKAVVHNDTKETVPLFNKPFKKQPSVKVETKAETQPAKVIEVEKVKTPSTIEKITTYLNDHRSLITKVALGALATGVVAATIYYNYDYLSSLNFWQVASDTPSETTHSVEPNIVATDISQPVVGTTQIVTTPQQVEVAVLSSNTNSLLNTENLVIGTAAAAGTATLTPSEPSVIEGEQPEVILAKEAPTEIPCETDSIPVLPENEFLVETNHLSGSVTENTTPIVAIPTQSTTATSIPTQTPMSSIPAATAISTTTTSFTTSTTAASTTTASSTTSTTTTAAPTTTPPSASSAAPTSPTTPSVSQESKTDNPQPTSTPKPKPAATIHSADSSASFFKIFDFEAHAKNITSIALSALPYGLGAVALIGLSAYLLKGKSVPASTTKRTTGGDVPPDTRTEDTKKKGKEKARKIDEFASDDSEPGTPPRTPTRGLFGIPMPQTVFSPRKDEAGPSTPLRIVPNPETGSGWSVGTPEGLKRKGLMITFGDRIDPIAVGEAVIVETDNLIKARALEEDVFEDPGVVTTKHTLRTVAAELLGVMSTKKAPAKHQRAVKDLQEGLEAALDIIDPSKDASSSDDLAPPVRLFDPPPPPPLPPAFLPGTLVPHDGGVGGPPPPPPGGLGVPGSSAMPKVVLSPERAWYEKRAKSCLTLGDPAPKAAKTHFEAFTNEELNILVYFCEKIPDVGDSTDKPEGISQENWACYLPHKANWVRFFALKGGFIAAVNVILKARRDDPTLEPKFVAPTKTEGKTLKVTAPTAPVDAQAALVAALANRFASQGPRATGDAYKSPLKGLGKGKAAELASPLPFKPNLRRTNHANKSEDQKKELLVLAIAQCFDELHSKLKRKLDATKLAFGTGHDTIDALEGLEEKSEQNQQELERLLDARKDLEQQIAEVKLAYKYAKEHSTDADALEFYARHLPEQQRLARDKVFQDQTSKGMSADEAKAFVASIPEITA